MFCRWWGKSEGEGKMETSSNWWIQIRSSNVEHQSNQDLRSSSRHHKACKALQPCWRSKSAGKYLHIHCSWATWTASLLSCEGPISDERQNILPWKCKYTYPHRGGHSQMINGGLEVFPLVDYLLELHFLFLGTSHSHLLPCSPCAASGCRNWLESKANWRFEMILYWLFFFFSIRET